MNARADLRVELRVLDLLAARLCHDLVSPVAAINNGVELLAEDEPEFIKEAVALVGDAARKATCRLQFYRFAYGYGGGGLTGAAPYLLAAELLDDAKIACDYAPAVRELPLEWQKLACNMLAIGGDALPRGGRLSLSGSEGGLSVEGAGEGNGPLPEACRALALETPVAELTSRGAGAYFAGLLAQVLGCRIEVAAEPGRFRIAAVPVPPAA